MALEEAVTLQPASPRTRFFPPIAGLSRLGAPLCDEKRLPLPSSPENTKARTPVLSRASPSLRTTPFAADAARGSFLTKKKIYIRKKKEDNKKKKKKKK